MSVGPLVIAAGLLLFTRVAGSGGYIIDVLPAVLVFGFGLAINVAPLTSTALSAVPADHSGIASAVNNDVARVAGLIAVAVLPVAAGITGDSYLHPAELTHGFRNAVIIAAIACAAGACSPSRRPQPAAPPAAAGPTGPAGPAGAVLRPGRAAAVR